MLSNRPANKQASQQAVPAAVGLAARGQGWPGQRRAHLRQALGPKHQQRHHAHKDGLRRAHAKDGRLHLQLLRLPAAAPLRKLQPCASE